MNNKATGKKNCFGIGLLELMLALAIIAIIILTSTRYYSVTESSRKVNDATVLIQNVLVAGEKWLATHPNYSGASLSAFVDRNYLPETAKLHPWGGTVEVIAAGSGSKLTITLNNILRKDCLNLANRISTMMPCEPKPNYSAYCPAGGATFSLEFDQVLKCQSPSNK